MDVKLSFGIRDEHTVLISEIGDTERGEKCNCKCPYCGGILLAKLGDIKQHHFAHKGNLCDPVKAQETGLHKLAKEIIQENYSILVPELIIKRDEIIPDDINAFVAAKVKIDLPDIKAVRVEYDSVEIEKQINDIIADTVIRIKGKPRIVEVAVTHKVDDVKEKKLAKIRTDAFEIDLSDLLKSTPTREEIVNAVLSDETNRNWIFNSKKEQLLEEKKEEFLKEYEKEEWKQEQADLQQALAEKRKEENKRNNILALQELMTPENYASELNRLHNDRRAAGLLKKLHFTKGKLLSEYPFYMDIPITGECVFTCDRRIWQGILFDDYVYKGFNQELCIFNVQQIRNRIFNGKSILEFDPKRAYRTPLIINGQRMEVSFSYDVIWRYFEYLELLGFIWHDHGQWYSKRPSSLNPPNRQAASILKGILNSVNRSSPGINQIIESELLSRLSEDDKNTVLEWNERKKRPPGYYFIPG